MNREIELRLAASPRDLARLAKITTFDGFAGARAITRQLSTLYYDTPDYVFFRSGFSLRVRDDGHGFVQTVKGASSGALASDRREYENALPSARPDLNAIPEQKLRAALIAAGADNILEAKFESSIRRISRITKNQAGDEVELAFDVGTIRVNTGEDIAIPVCEIELELKKGAPVSLYTIARQLSRKAPLALLVESKAARAFGALAKREVSGVKAGRMELPAQCTVENAFRAALHHCLRHLSRNVTAVAQARNPEGVHQLRVGLRRLRAALSGFGKAFRSEAIEALLERAKSLSESLSVTRELDVFAYELLPAVPHSGLPLLKRYLEEMRRESWDQTVALVQSDDFTGFVLDLAIVIETRAWRGSEPNENTIAFSRAASALASEILAARLKKVRKRAKTLATLDIAQRHDLRIALKKLRYSAEFFAPLFPSKPVTEFLERLSRLQDLFGAMNDAATAEIMLSRIVKRAAQRERKRLSEPVALIEEWYRKKADADWNKTKKRWKRFEETECFWEPSIKAQSSP